MLTDSSTSPHLKFRIQFGDLKDDIKDNYYLATNERAVENQIATGIFIVEKSKDKYVMVLNEVMGVETVKYINLNYFKEWHYVK